MAVQDPIGQVLKLPCTNYHAPSRRPYTPGGHGRARRDAYARLSSSAALKLRDEAAAKWAARGIPEEALDVIYWNYQALDWINRIDLEDLGVSPEVIDRLGPADSDGDFELYKGAKDGGWQDEGDE